MALREIPSTRFWRNQGSSFRHACILIRNNYIQIGDADSSYICQFNYRQLDNDSIQSKNRTKIPALHSNLLRNKPHQINS